MSDSSFPTPMPCRLPQWALPQPLGKKKQTLLKTKPGTKCQKFNLDEEGLNSVIHISNVLDSAQLGDYIKCAATVPRVQGIGAFMKEKPRKEVFYKHSGSYVYSNVEHCTYPYPQHVNDVITQLENAISSACGVTLPFGKLDITGDICYDSSILRGGSVGAHSDDEAHWPFIVIFSLGQTRFLRIRNKSTKEFTNVELAHNSVVIMQGETFQKLYTHQVDKLFKDEPVGVRLSLNIRYAGQSEEISQPPTKKSRVRTTY